MVTVWPRLGHRSRSSFGNRQPLNGGRLLSLLKRNSFITGVLTAVAGWLAWWTITNFRIVVGHVEDSPSGKYALMIMAPMEQTFGGSYVVTLRDKVTSQVLRTVRVTLNSKELTKSLRGLPVSMIWDASESCADVSVDGDFLLRMSVPTLRP